MAASRARRKRASVLGLAGLLVLAVLCTPASASDASLQGTFERSEQYLDGVFLGPWQTAFRRLSPSSLVTKFPRAQAGARSAVRVLLREQCSSEPGKRAKSLAITAFSSLDRAMTAYQLGYQILPPGTTVNDSEQHRIRLRKAQEQYRLSSVHLGRAVAAASAAQLSFESAQRAGRSPINPCAAGGVVQS